MFKLYKKRDFSHWHLLINDFHNGVDEIIQKWVKPLKLQQYIL